MIHRAGYCLRVAIASNRTMIIKGDGIGRYSKNGWTAIFKPVSNCTYAEIIKVFKLFQSNIHIIKGTKNGSNVDFYSTIRSSHRISTE
jgi:hypothetical protein